MNLNKPAVIKKLQERFRNENAGRGLYTAFLVPTMLTMFSTRAFAADTIWTKASAIMQDVYTQILGISTIAAVVTAAMTNHTPCLLDEAATFMKVQYLSDLRFLSTDGRSRLAAFLETFDAAEYILFQWNDAIEYLKAGVKQQTAHVARAQLLCALRTT